MILELLADPSPATPPSGSRRRVERRARQLRRRRRAAAVAPVVGLLPLAALAGSRLGDGEGEVRSAGTTTTVPEPPPDRGEVFEPTVLPEGADLVATHWLHKPGEGTFELSLHYEFPGGELLRISRFELRASVVDQTAGFLSDAGITVSSNVAGRAYTALPADGQNQITWVVDRNILIEVSGEQVSVERLAAVLDGIDYRAPLQRCVTDELSAQEPPCEALDEVIPKGALDQGVFSPDELD